MIQLHNDGGSGDKDTDDFDDDGGGGGMVVVVASMLMVTGVEMAVTVTELTLMRQLHHGIDSAVAAAVAEYDTTRGGGRGEGEGGCSC